MTNAGPGAGTPAPMIRPAKTIRSSNNLELLFLSGVDELYSVIAISSGTRFSDPPSSLNSKEEVTTAYARSVRTPVRPRVEKVALSRGVRVLPGPFTGISQSPSPGGIAAICSGIGAIRLLPWRPESPETSWTAYLPAYLEIRALCGKNQAVAESYYAARSGRHPAWRELREATERDRRRRELDPDRVRALDREASRLCRERQAARSLTFAELLARSPGDAATLPGTCSARRSSSGGSSTARPAAASS
jgi:hypothetical protein